MDGLLYTTLRFREVFTYFAAPIRSSTHQIRPHRLGAWYSNYCRDACLNCIWLPDSINLSIRMSGPWLHIGQYLLLRYLPDSALFGFRRSSIIRDLAATRKTNLGKSVTQVELSTKEEAHIVGRLVGRI
jgi:hypothetical protein